MPSSTANLHGPGGVIPIDIEAVGFVVTEGVYLFVDEDGVSIASIPVPMVVTLSKPDVISFQKVMGARGGLSG